MSEINKTEATPTDSTNFITKMAEIYKEFLLSYEFKPGQLVTWKNGLKNRVKPSLGEPALVVSLLDEPFFDTEKDSGTPYFKEPLDMVVGILPEEEDTGMMFFHVDKRRFKPFQS